MPCGIENAVQLLRSAQFTGLQAEHFSRAQAVIIALAMSPMRLGIVIGHKALMSQLCSLPTGHLLEMDLTHAPHHLKMRLNKILPALTCMDILLLDFQGLTNGKQLPCTKDSAIVCNETLGRTKLLDCRIQDDQDTS